MKQAESRERKSPKVHDYLQPLHSPNVSTVWPRPTCRLGFGSKLRCWDNATHKWQVPLDIPMTFTQDTSMGSSTIMSVSVPTWRALEIFAAVCWQNNPHSLLTDHKGFAERSKLCHACDACTEHSLIPSIRALDKPQCCMPGEVLRASVAFSVRAKDRLVFFLYAGEKSGKASEKGICLSEWKSLARFLSLQE